MAPHSSTLAWKIPWMEEPGRLQSMGSLSWTWLSDFTFTFHFHALEKEMATHSNVLAWRIPGTADPGRLPSMGSHRAGHDWRDLAAAAAEQSRWCWSDHQWPSSELTVLYPPPSAYESSGPLIVSQREVAFGQKSILPPASFQHPK